MNRTKLKTYAPQARRDFIQAITDRAAVYGLTDKTIEPITENGDVAIIGGRAFPRSIATKRKALEEWIAQYGFAPTMDAIAYTWFNRLVAIRYMELHGYLDHGYRVLSHPDASKSIPEILEQAEHLDLPGLDKHKVIELKLEGSKEAELYRMLLLAQCNALHKAMPFLFEWIGDETELLLPDNLLHTDSLIRKLAANIDEEDWQEVEIIGWLYQFYISERKSEVMARKSAVPTEDIPAVTQLFTPHWIVRYLVENSLGRLWLLNRPSSRLREHMSYYIEGEAETDFLKITKPEDIRLLDPACGSGHMLTYAFDLLFLIYEEAGYVPNEIPALILQHNLYGLEICPRAAQLAELALVFKARAKSRRFFQPGTLVQPRILALQDIHFDEGELRDYIAALDLGDLFNQAMLQLLHQFEEATTFGSLIQPCLDQQNITFARQAIEAKDLGGQLFLRETQAKVLRVFEQAEMLCQRYHVVVANPPYMGAGAYSDRLKNFILDAYRKGKTDLYGCFLERCSSLAIKFGYYGMITIPNWMFLEEFADLRRWLLSNQSLSSLIHLGRGVFGADFGSVAFVFMNSPSGPPAVFRKLYSKFSLVADNNKLAQVFHQVADIKLDPGVLRVIPGAPLAYWLSAKALESFCIGTPLAQLAAPKQGIKTGNNDLFLRFWWEVVESRSNLGAHNIQSASESRRRWFPCTKGGPFRKWYGNHMYVVNWENNGEEIRKYTGGTSRIRSRPQNTQYFFKQGVTWSKISISSLSARLFPKGYCFESIGSVCFSGNENTDFTLLSLLNSAVSAQILQAIAPSVDFGEGAIGKVPVIDVNGDRPSQIASAAVELARTDWDNFETSWDFLDLPLLRKEMKGETLAASWEAWRVQCAAAIHRMQELETENNRLFINAYGLADELKPEVPEDQITIARADARRDIAAFLSYAVGCMMGRYALDHPGLILANPGDTLREFLVKVERPQDQLTFAPDEDGIIPVLDGEWFEDDIVSRAHAFLRATFGEATLNVNLRFIEKSLGKDLRKYFLTDFSKDHLSNERAYGYKKRPIYWLFSSGKERAFQCLVYLHRYHEGTLARMRTEYVIPLQGKIAARIEQLASDIQKASSTSQRKKPEKERDTFLKQQTELRTFDEKLRHYADQRISLNLDDGVKVNYGKFGDLLAEVKAVTGGTDED
jgi:hypothetical protein